MDNSTFEIKEYESLKQEILDHQKRREQLFIFTIMVVGVVLGFALKENGIPFIIISFIPYFLIYNYCRSTSINSSIIICIGTYILHFIESKHKENLHWETVWNKIAKGEKNGEKSSGYWYDFCFIASIVVCISMILLILIAGKLKPLKLQQSLEIASIIVFAVLHIFTCCLCIIKGAKLIYWSEMNKKAREYWNKCWENLKSEIEPEDE